MKKYERSALWDNSVATSAELGDLDGDGVRGAHRPSALACQHLVAKAQRLCNLGHHI